MIGLACSSHVSARTEIPRRFGSSLRLPLPLCPHGMGVLCCLCSLPSQTTTRILGVGSSVSTKVGGTLHILFCKHCGQLLHLLLQSIYLCCLFCILFFRISKLFGIFFGMHHSLLGGFRINGGRTQCLSISQLFYYQCPVPFPPDYIEGYPAIPSV